MNERRQALANTYRQKSDESFLAATECFANGRYLSTCNRAWYSMFHMINAGSWAYLTEEPEGGLTWHHKEQHRILRALLKTSGRHLKYWGLLPLVGIVRDARTNADYLAIDEGISKEDAAGCLRTASRVRRCVCEIVGWK